MKYLITGTTSGIGQEIKNKWVECSLKCNKHVVDKKYGIGYYTN